MYSAGKDYCEGVKLRKKSLYIITLHDILTHLSEYIESLYLHKQMTINYSGTSAINGFMWSPSLWSTLHSVRVQCILLEL